MGQVQYRYSPREHREPCNLPLLIVDELGREMLGRLGNISQNGFMAECEEKVRIGSIVRTELPGRGLVTAEIRWALGWRFGARILKS